MSNLKRYTESWACGEYDGMEEDSLAGEWVKFDDIKELLQTGAQHTQHKICPTCSGTGWIIGEFACMDHQCSKCGGSGKLRASA